MITSQQAAGQLHYDAADQIVCSGTWVPYATSKAVDAHCDAAEALGVEDDSKWDTEDEDIA